MRASGRLGAAIAGLLTIAAPGTLPRAAAQMMLPGAVAPTPEGSTQAPAPGRKKGAATGSGDDGTARRGIAVTVPAATALFGRTLLLNGNGSQFVLAAGAGKELAANRVVLVGEKIGASRESCRVEGPGGSTPVTDLGRPAGLARYRVDYPACPIVFEVLDGAVLVPREPATCDLVEADCRVRLAGLWGPAPSEVGPDRIKTLERTRGAAETAMRGNYRALTTSTRDRPTVMGVAKEQAQFSSSREETCRDYAEEARHNFCATAMTQGRAAQLHVRLGSALAEKQDRKGKRGAPAR